MMLPSIIDGAGIRIFFIIRFLLILLPLVVPNPLLTNQIVFLDEHYPLYVWKKFQYNLNEIFREGNWTDAWQRPDFKPMYSFPCKWTNMWFTKFTSVNQVETDETTSCFNSPSNQGFKSLWTPKREELALWSTRKFCEVVKGHNVLIAGDSLQEELFFTTLSALRSRTIVTNSTDNKMEDGEKMRLRNRQQCSEFCAEEGFCAGAQTIDCGADLPSFDLSFSRMDKLDISDDPQRITRAPWITMLSERNISLLILSHGPHFSKRDTDKIVSQTRVVLSYLQKQHPTVSVVWRTAAHGHPDMLAMFDNSPLEEPPDISQFTEYNYGNFQYMNKLLEGLISDYFPEVLFIDIFDSTVLRADSHADMLHYCIPGPIDSWLLFIFNALIRLPDPKADLESNCLHYKYQRHKHLHDFYNAETDRSHTGTGNSMSRTSTKPCYGVTHSVHGSSWWPQGLDFMYDYISDEGVEVREIETFAAEIEDGSLLKSVDHRHNAFYQVVNGSRHVFPNALTYINMGYHWGDEMLRDAWDLLAIPLGKPLDYVWEPIERPQPSDP